jgi:hypothetical protein
MRADRSSGGAAILALRSAHNVGREMLTALFTGGAVQIESTVPGGSSASRK